MTDDDLKSLFEQTRRHFDVVAERMEKRIGALVESVAALDEKIDRKIDDLEERMRRAFEDTQAVINSRTQSSTVAFARSKKVSLICRLASSASNRRLTESH